MSEEQSLQFCSTVRSLWFGTTSQIKLIEYIHSVFKILY